MLDFIGKRSASIVVFSAFIGLFLAGVEILLSAYIVKLLSLIGFGQSGSGMINSLLGNFSSPVTALIGFVVITALRAILHVAKGYCAVSANELFVTRLRLVCITSTLNKVGPRYNSSRIYSFISDTFLKSALTFYGIAHAVPFIFQGLLLLIFLLILSTHLSFIGLSFVLLAGLAVFLTQRRISVVVRPLSKINDSLYKSLKRIVENILLIRFCKLEEVEIEQTKKLLTNYLMRVRKGNLLSLISENIPSLMGSVVIAVLFSIQLGYQSVSAGVFISFIYVFMRFVQCLSQVVSFSSSALINFPYFMAAYDYYNKLPKDELAGFDSCLVKQRRSKKAKSIDAIRKVAKEAVILDRPPAVDISELAYSYETNTVVFEKLSFSILPGQQCVIVGPSGVGKSTLLNLIVGEIQPQVGRIQIDDVVPNDFFDTYCHEAAYAGPEPLLFEGSIRENLLYGVSRTVPDVQIINMLVSLGLESWLNKIECNLNLPLVGANSIGTSSGQAQRLSIARALLRQPKLLILDEVTANLDSGSEQQVLSLLELFKGVATVIIVTHSLEMMKNADVIVNLEQIGTIEQGLGTNGK